VAKWRKRGSVEDTQMGPRQAHSTVLSIEEEAVIVAFRRHTLLPLDDCLYALRPTFPHPLPGRRLRSNLPRGGHVRRFTGVCNAMGSAACQI